MQKHKLIGIAATVMLIGSIASVAKGAVGLPAAPGDEAVKLLSEYIKVNTTNPPGNETLGAEYLAKILRANGIEAQLFETAPGRSCVYARLKGDGSKKPIILLNHIDVVPAQASDWTHDPFSGDIVDGEIFGRGALDMKGMAIAELETMLQLKRAGKPLKRDVIFLGTPDEEVGGTYGAEWFTKNHPELCKDAEFLINEGYFIEATDKGEPKYWGVDVSEKSVLWLRLTAKGNAGHGSMPMPDSAPNRLTRALEKIVNNPPAPTVLPEVREFFHSIAPREDEPLKGYFANIDESVKDPKAYAAILPDKLRSAMLRNTVSLTVLKAGYKTNVIPAEATAELDCRLLPGVTKEAFIAEVQKKMGDSTIEVSVVDNVMTGSSPMNTDLYAAIKAVAAQEQPGVPVVPVVVPWFTDSHWFRDFGTVAYGFEPMEVDATHLASMHGKNERIPVKSFIDANRRLLKIIEKVVY
jgi:acetylornithine deacetylase/succinyl-diaminopimelate desuccinylase-like protein